MVVPQGRGRTVRVFTKAREDYCLTIRNGRVVLALNDTADRHQQWLKDDKYSDIIKDESGFPAIALVNIATGEAIKHSVGAGFPVTLGPYDDKHLDVGALWTATDDDGGAIRMVNNIRLNFDARRWGNLPLFDGTELILYEWNEGNNQRWRIAPICN